LTLAHSNGAFDESTSTAGNGHHQRNRTTQTERTKIIHQAAGAVSLRLGDFSFLLSVRGQTPTLLLPLIAVLVRRQAAALPHPGIAASKLLSMSQSSFTKRASGL
jgi:hypothetical protein